VSDCVSFFLTNNLEKRKSDSPLAPFDTAPAEGGTMKINAVGKRSKKGMTRTLPREQSCSSLPRHFPHLSTPVEGGMMKINAIGKSWKKRKPLRVHYQPPKQFQPFPNIPLSRCRPSAKEAFGPRNGKSPFLGREEQMVAILRTIESSMVHEERNPVYFLHASPGVGKTRILTELYLKDFPADKEHLKDKIFFIAADFNRDACADVRDLSLPYANAKLFVLLRLYYIEFVDQNQTSWERFMELNYKDTPEKHKIMTFILNQFQNRIKESGCEKIVILVDEILKTEILDDSASANFSNSCRHVLSRLADDHNSPLRPDLVLFSTLSAPFMLEEQSATGRGVYPICTLPLLSMEDSRTILSSGITCEFVNEAHRQPLNRDHCIDLLATICGGHGRSLEYIIRECSQSPETKQLLDDIIRNAAKKLTGTLKGTPYNLVVKAILLGEKVRKLDRWGTTEETFESLVTKGILVDSFQGDSEGSFIPKCPELFLYSWVSSRAFESDCDAKNCLSTILNLHNRFINVNFEVFHRYWEHLIRFARTDRYKKMSLLEVYGFPKKPNETENSLGCFVDAKTPLLPAWYDKDSTSELSLNTLISATDPLNPGWDTLIVYEGFPAASSPVDQRYALPVFIQNKFSKEDATTRLGNKVVNKAHKHCQKFLGECRYRECELFPAKSAAFPYGFSHFPFVLIFVMRQDVRPSAIAGAPPNVMFCSEEELKRLYGPTLSGFVSHLVPGLTISKV
jgi:hypothetical protein